MYGEGVENYMNDAPADLGAKLNPGNPVTPIKGYADLLRRRCVHPSPGFCPQCLRHNPLMPTKASVRPNATKPNNTMITAAFSSPVSRSFDTGKS